MKRKETEINLFFWAKLARQKGARVLEDIGQMLYGHSRLFFKATNIYISIILYIEVR